MIIRFIGTSGSCLTATRTNPSILIDNDLLLDVGEGTTQKLLQLNVVEEIQTILISHLHVDHFIGIFTFLWKKWLTNSQTPLTIYGPPEISSAIPQILKITHTPSNAFRFKIQYNPLDPGEDILKHDIISTTRVLHPAYTLAYRIDLDKSICYSSDTAPLDRIISLATGCDVLIHDSSCPSKTASLAHKFYHSTPQDAAEIANKAHVKKLVLFHIIGESEKFKPFREEAQKIFDGEVVIAKDMEILKI